MLPPVDDCLLEGLSPDLKKEVTNRFRCAAFGHRSYGVEGVMSVAFGALICVKFVMGKKTSATVQYVCPFEGNLENHDV